MSGPWRPADAYFEMVNLLGEERLFDRAPLVGVELAVMGVDQIRTFWEVTDAENLWLRSKLRDNPHLRLVSERRYARVEMA